MFTGIIEEVGKVLKIQKNTSHWSIVIESICFDKPAIGSSIAVNGVCLTQVKQAFNQAEFNVVDQTLKVTNLAHLKEGDLVNLERALQMGSRLEGHLVQGHVDTTVKILSIDSTVNEWWIECPKAFETYLISKGSIALDGISLTLAHLKEGAFKIALIPHTLKKTHLQHKKVGDLLNLEVDFFAKYALNHLQKSSYEALLETNG